MPLKNKLNRFKSHLVEKSDAKKEACEKKIVNHPDAIPYLEKWQEVGVSPHFLDNDYCLIRKKSYSLSYQHGKYMLGDFVHAVSLWNESNVNHPLSAKGFQPDELFFFDTETTGLGGGAGTSIFILGHASIQGNEVHLTQHILPHPGAEIPLYDSFLRQVDYKTLVTYNGKSFDWPQVKTNHTLIREHVPKLPQFGHFDLYHASRRMWKHRLDKLKLAIVEKEVLEVDRKDDTPGFLAPMIYFDFVERKDPEGMIKMLHHNEWDILSLISLYTHLSFQILGEDTLQTAAEKLEVGKWYSALGEVATAKEVYFDLQETDGIIASTSKLQLGYIYKKQKNVEKSLEYFLEVRNGGFCLEQIDACIELAKIYEHTKKDYQEALNCCNQALELIGKGYINRKVNSEELEKRVQRIIRKKFPG